MFGLNPARTRYLPAKGVKPPFRLLWHYTERPLLEFPPVYASGKLYAVNNNGTPSPSTPNTGKVLWERRIGRLNASSPDLLQRPPLHRQPRPRPCRQARRQDRQDHLETAAARARRVLAAGPRQDPLLRLRRRRALRAQHPQRQRALGDLPGRAGEVGARLLRRRPLRRRLRRLHERGRRLDRQADLAERLARPGLRRLGGLLLDPGARLRPGLRRQQRRSRLQLRPAPTGPLAWTHSTGGYVYSGPTVASTPQTAPTVYIGSFDGNVYALNAKDGEPRWSTRPAGGDRLALRGRQHRLRRRVHQHLDPRLRHADRPPGLPLQDGAYTPVISDGRRIFLTGYSSINALAPVRPKAGGEDQERKALAGRRQAARPPLEAGPAEPAAAGGHGNGSG